MRITTIIATILGLGGAVAAPIVTPVAAQTLRDAGPPAEFPPPSYTGKQYVDSKGCVYIRAGIDGSVTWVPRVTRQRKLLCGQTPSLSAEQLARAGAAPARPAPPEAVEITIAPGQAAPSRPAATPTAPPRAPSTAPEPTVIAGPAPAPARPAPVAQTRGQPRTQATAQTRATTRTPSPAPAPTVFTSRPATAAPAAAPTRVQTATVIAPTTRIVPRHIYENRQNTQGASVPRGYRKSWEDDRLNPYRGERTAAPSVALPAPSVPQGYRPAWEDDRLNPRRAQVTQQGEAATDAVWTRTVPRTLRQQPTRGYVATIPNNARAGNSPFWQPPVRAQASQPRLSTRSSVAEQSFVRVAVYRAEAQARTAAQSLVTTGMPLRLGTLRHKGEMLQVVVAGPFATQAMASAAVKKLHASGFGNARLRVAP